MTRLEQTLARVRRNGAIGGGALLAASVLLAVVTGAGAEQFLRSYLIGFMFWLGIALGSLAILMLHHLTGGAWGLVIRRHLEAASRTMPFLTLAFLPIAIGVRVLYIWARPEVMAADPSLQAKQLYLNAPFFLARAVIYFAVWNLLVYVINRWSLEQDAGGRQPVGSERKFRQLSAPGLMAYGLTITFASVDWVMSLDPHWFSTIFGVLFMGAQALSAMAFAIVALAATSRDEPLKEIVEPSHFHDLGKLLFAFVMLWAYFGFSQFLIIWSGNLPEEIPWYIERLHGGWGAVALIVLIGSFILPFLLLLSRDIKRNTVALGTIAGLVLVVRIADLTWMIAPRPGHHGFPIHWLDLTLPLALGGLWIALFARELTRRRLLAVNDPYFEEVFAHGHH